MSRFWSSIVNDLKPYTPGEQPARTDLIKLNTNENPYGPSPKVLDSLCSEVADTLRLYPDPNATELKSAIAQHYQIKKQQVFVGNGSDEVLAHVFQGLLSHESPMLFPDITYSFYPVYCGLYRINYEQVPLTDSFEINIKDYVRPNGGIIFPNPNAPTGIFLSLESIEYLLKQNRDSVVVIDEAYIDFGGDTSVPLIERYPNLLVIQTLSKSRSLAGLRVGFAIGHPILIDALERVKNSFNSYPLDRLAITGAVAAIQDHAYFDETRKKIIRTREALANNLQDIGFEVLPSKANFVFARHNYCDAIEIYDGLREEGIIVRHFNQDRVSQFLRITIGTRKECNALLKSLEGILQGLLKIRP
ncbi:histidinol-phosphate aminotransferase [bacterium BMS3Bbin06]|nr:histidinol-phosphate aminotransferase [bacterium BMS3Abin08]GBE34038.1 histidinol-phosphate aminotransferase [bacterium BMS3Bbin06]